MLVSKLLFVATSLATLTAGQSVAVQNDLQTINSDVIAYKNAFDAYNGTVVGAVPIQNANNRLNSDLKKTASDVQNSAAWTAAGCNSYCNYFVSPIAPNIKTLCAAYRKKKALLAQNGIGSSVSSGLKSAESGILDLIKLFENRCPVCNAARSNVQVAFQDCFNGAGST